MNWGILTNGQEYEFYQRRVIDSKVEIEAVEQTRSAPDDTYVPFYRSNKCSIVGVTSPEHFEQMVERVNTLMRELLKFDYEPTAEIENIVATAELDSFLSLETIAIGLGLEQTEYEPEQFPALINRSGDSVLLVFSSGKIVCTGLTNLEQISSAIDEITEQIETLSAS